MARPPRRTRVISAAFSLIICVGRISYTAFARRRGHDCGSVAPQAASYMLLPSVMRPAGLAASEAPAGPTTSTQPLCSLPCC